jgi:hypothetical protein
VFEGDAPPELSARGWAQLVPIDTAFAPSNLPNAALTGDRASTAARIVFESVPPGRYLITPASGLAGWWGRSATLGGVDVTAVPFEVTAAASLHDLVITLGRGPTILTGTVMDDAGAPVFAHVLVVFPVDHRTRHPLGLAGSVRGARPNSKGRYEVRGLPPGEYLVALTADLDWMDRESGAFTELEAGAVRVTLIEGQEFVQNLRAGR